MKAPLSSCDDSMSACCLCTPASQNTAAVAALFLWRISAKRCLDLISKQENNWESRAYETALMMCADIKVEMRTAELQIQQQLH